MLNKYCLKAFFWHLSCFIFMFSNVVCINNPQSHFAPLNIWPRYGVQMKWCWWCGRGQKLYIALFTDVMKETLSLLFLEKPKSLKAIMAGNLEKLEGGGIYFIGKERSSLKNLFIIWDRTYFSNIWIVILDELIITS